MQAGRDEMITRAYGSKVPLIKFRRKKSGEDSSKRLTLGTCADSSSAAASSKPSKATTTFGSSLNILNQYLSDSSECSQLGSIVDKRNFRKVVGLEKSIYLTKIKNTHEACCSPSSSSNFLTHLFMQVVLPMPAWPTTQITRFPLRNWRISSSLTFPAGSPHSFMKSSLLLSTLLNLRSTATLRGSSAIWRDTGVKELLMGTMAEMSSQSMRARRRVSSSNWLLSAAKKNNGVRQYVWRLRVKYYFIPRCRSSKMKKRIWAGYLVPSSSAAGIV